VHPETRKPIHLPVPIEEWKAAVAKRQLPAAARQQVEDSREAPNIADDASAFTQAFLRRGKTDGGCLKPNAVERIKAKLRSQQPESIADSKRRRIETLSKSDGQKQQPARVTVHEFLTQAELDDVDLVEFWDSDAEDVPSTGVKSFGASTSNRAALESKKASGTRGLVSSDLERGVNRAASCSSETKEPSADSGGGIWAFCFPDERQQAKQDHRVKRQEVQAVPPGGRQKMRRLTGKQAPGRDQATVTLNEIEGGVVTRTTDSKRRLEVSESRSPAKARRPG